MRHFLSTLIFTILLIGCQSNPSTDIEAQEAAGSTLAIELPCDSRLQFGDKYNNLYPLYWTELDYIYANSKPSSQIVIDKENPSCAKFEFSEVLEYPLAINYEFYHAELPNSNPFSSTSIAFFLSYFEPMQKEWGENGEFVRPNMYAYTESPKNAIELKHLAGVLRFAIKGDKEGRTLDRIEVTSHSGSYLSGYFVINEIFKALAPEYQLSSGLITPYDDLEDINFNNSSTTLLCDTSKPLSTSEDRILYLSLPEGNHGVCNIDIIATDGSKMHCVWDSKNLKPGIIREFSSITFYSSTKEFNLIDNMEAEDGPLEFSSIFGYVKDINGKPLSGVAVSDGFKVVTTDENGYYAMVPSSDCCYIYISVPSEFEIPINELGQPCFYQKYPFKQQYDFTLTPLAGGKESKFALFALADPQIWESKGFSRLQNEAIPGVAAHGATLSQSMPCYGITLGDIISTNPSKSGNASAYREPLRELFSKSRIGMAVFQIMGNHDNTYAYHGGGIDPEPDRYNSNWQIKMQRDHEAIFGPANYSFNRGDVHIVGMRNVEYYINSSNEYSSRIGFSIEQIEWLRQDLALVPKDKMVILCTHIPFIEKSSGNVTMVTDLLAQFDRAHILTGHSHINWNYEHKTTTRSGENIYEHVVSALCGSWWDSNMAMDGSPVGYQVFICENNNFSDWYYMGYTKGMNIRSHQMRLYRGDAITGGEKSGSDNYGVKGYYKFNYASNVLLANIYNADSSWRVEVYEDGAYSGDMTLIPNLSRPYHNNSSTTASEGIGGDGSFKAPYYSTLTQDISSDMHFAGLHLGILGKKDNSYNTYGTCYHMYKYTLKNPKAKITVKATDRFGNIYTETKITEGTDYSITGL